MTSLQLTIDGMSCGHCVMAVQKALRALDGVDVQQVQIGSASLQFDPAKRTANDILEAVRDAGYEPHTAANA
ncbi:MAG: heavy-metal-associated domain-containing protein [Gemmatimonadaceae bacterium]|nr:heavy-metal-associated domain-containing protein [Gemmatimonadaceae bacterium]